MALSGIFLTPVGLIALLTVIPVIILYFIQPDPRKVELPTLRFLTDEDREDASNPLLERFKRNLLLVIQLLVLIALAVALAGPYVSVSKSQTFEQTVFVLDGSASMGVETEDGARFDAAVTAARESTTSSNSIVFAGSDNRVVLRSGGADEVETTLARLTVSDTPTDLGTAISQAASIAGENARIVVLSDFADDTGWADDVQSARARNLRVDLRQFEDGGNDNVGIVDRSFSGRTVTLGVKNYGGERVTRAVQLGDQTRSIDIDPDSVRRVELTVPTGGAKAQVTPGDSFSTDDTAYIGSPADSAVDVLLLTNNRSRHLTTALSVIEEVHLTVDSPPTVVEDDYDVLLYSDLDPDRLLKGNVEAGRNLVESGGGVAILAQKDFPEKYGDLSLIESDGLGINPTLGRIKNDELTRGIDFPPPEVYHRGSLRSGTALIQTAENAPVVATDTRGPGRILYYGYVAGSDPFRYHYQYPVFWKRAVFQLAGRESLDSLNRETGTRLQFENATVIQRPNGRVEARTVLLDRTGFYSTGEGQSRIGVSLYSVDESDVASVSIEDRPDKTQLQTRKEEQNVPRPLTPVVALLALVLVVSEVALLRRRGDL